MKLALVFLLTLSSAFAVTVKKLDLKKRNSTGKLDIHYKGILRTNPELVIKKNKILVTIPKANLVKSLKRKVNFATSKSMDTTLKASRNAKGTVVEAKFPFDISKKKDSVTLYIKDDLISLNVPRVKVKALKKVKKAVKKTNKKQKKSLKEVLDENYLNQLVQQEKMKTGGKVDNSFVDKVKVEKSSVNKKSFSMMSYAGKFVAFLGLVLLLFYGVILIFKKGVIKRTKLGFLNKTNQVVVLSTTHISPKKSLMMVKVHKQVFLIASTESGINFLSEIDDVSGIIKDGEEKISGENFDTNLVSQSNDEQLEERVVIKENILESKPLVAQTRGSMFKEQLKNKIKNLKPIEQQR
jgi:flagellar biogenesis protein FliO